MNIKDLIEKQAQEMQQQIMKNEFGVDVSPDELQEINAGASATSPNPVLDAEKDVVLGKQAQDYSSATGSIPLKKTPATPAKPEFKPTGVPKKKPGVSAMLGDAASKFRSFVND